MVLLWGKPPTQWTGCFLRPLGYGDGDFIFVVSMPGIWSAVLVELNCHVFLLPHESDKTAQWKDNMPWLEVTALFVAGIAVLIAIGSLLISRRVQKISELQALPRVSVVRTWLGRLRGGERNLYFNVEQISDRPDWVVARVSIKRSWRNFRKRCFLARGEVVSHSPNSFGRILPNSERTGNWERCIVYEPPVRDAAVFLHPDTPDCEVKLEIVLNTSPSPIIKRHIKSLKESPAMRSPSGVIE